ncbi:L-fucose mutarotase [Pullulanibacillus sp. KACC 23026]|uniref:L-fucose mutarotase n=1 Tax=Pullulanibacillus sp. KACC 23026 TaxID=3028315 RepID=UPI0023AF3B1A|nr:L-fucose mutarotase [Pullulanibacillus sp. KACC 23026]WEG11081.1 L-fucose mutarotase [Pullulanibacillus sp. KACC 23026]
MLKSIPKNLSPEMIKVLMEMGHGDEVVLADANFPGSSLNSRVIRADGLRIPGLLESIMKLFPLDCYSKTQVGLMQVVPGDHAKPDIWNEYQNILKKSGEPFKIEYIERFAFYERTKATYAVIQTGETALYGNILLKKGVI